jgi:hypothetical protein
MATEKVGKVELGSCRNAESNRDEQRDQRCKDMRPDQANFDRWELAVRLGIPLFISAGWLF